MGPRESLVELSHTACRRVAGGAPPPTSLGPFGLGQPNARTWHFPIVHMYMFLCVLWTNCSRHGFLYIRGSMQMVIAPNDLFSWNNRFNEYNVTVDIYTFFLRLCTWTYSVQARILKPWRGNLPRLPAISSSCHVFPPPLSGFNWRSLSPLGGPVPGPSTSKMAPLSTGSAHTPLPGFRTQIKDNKAMILEGEKNGC